jgi:hypothetical protein
LWYNPSVSLDPAAFVLPAFSRSIARSRSLKPAAPTFPEERVQ